MSVGVKEVEKETRESSVRESKRSVLVSIEAGFLGFHQERLKGELLRHGEQYMITVKCWRLVCLCKNRISWNLTFEISLQIKFDNHEKKKLVPLHFCVYWKYCCYLIFHFQNLNINTTKIWKLSINPLKSIFNSPDPLASNNIVMHWWLITCSPLASQSGRQISSIHVAFLHHTE